MNTSHPLVSVMIPVYNGRDTLPRAIKSLELQTFEDWEAIIVDDGSTDGLREFILTLKDARFRVLQHAKNLGRAAARQTALDAVRGEYVTYLDCDDFYHPLKLERQLEVFRRSPNVDYCSCGLGSFDSRWQLRRVRASFTIDHEIFIFGKTFRLSPVASMIRTRIAKAASYNLKLSLGEDTDYFQRVLDQRAYAAIPDILYYYGEYGSVTKAKMLSSYIYSARAAGSYWRVNKRWALRSFFIHCSKALSLLGAYPFVSVQWVLDRRGVAPSGRESEEFEWVLGRVQPEVR